MAKYQVQEMTRFVTIYVPLWHRITMSGIIRHTANCRWHTSPQNRRGHCVNHLCDEASCSDCVVFNPATRNSADVGGWKIPAHGEGVDAMLGSRRITRKIMSFGIANIDFQDNLCGYVG